MARNNKYLRPYCRNCKIAYSLIKNIGLVRCPNCQEKLKLKSFSPYIPLSLSFSVLFLAFATILLKQSPVVWIGGFIWGALLGAKAFDNWERIKDLDKF